MHSTSTGACLIRRAIVHHCMAYIKQKARTNVMETEGESESDGLGVSGRGRERRGASIRLLAEPRRDPNCEGGRRGRSKPAVALWHETSRSADAPGTIKAALPCRLLHEDFRTVPESPGPQPLCTRCHGLPLATLGSPEREKCPFCPCFSTPSRDWGRPTSALRAYTLFLHLPGRFETLAVVVIFSPFWAGKFSSWLVDSHVRVGRTVAG